MVHRVCQAALAAVVAAICLAAGSTAQAQYYGPPGWTSPEPNYYATPEGPEGLTAAMYPCPRPTPPLTGQTIITYGPLAPQQNDVSPLQPLRDRQRQRFLDDHFGPVWASFLAASVAAEPGAGAAQTRASELPMTRRVKTTAYDRATNSKIQA